MVSGYQRKILSGHEANFLSIHITGPSNLVHMAHSDCAARFLWWKFLDEHAENQSEKRGVGLFERAFLYKISMALTRQSLEHVM